MFKRDSVKPLSAERVSNAYEYDRNFMFKDSSVLTRF